MRIQIWLVKLLILCLVVVSQSCDGDHVHPRLERSLEQLSAIVSGDRGAGDIDESWASIDMLSEVRYKIANEWDILLIEGTDISISIRASDWKQAMAAMDHDGRRFGIEVLYSILQSADKLEKTNRGYPIVGLVAAYYYNFVTQYIDHGCDDNYVESYKERLKELVLDENWNGIQMLERLCCD